MAEDDPYEVFSSSLHSLFDHVVPANGDPLELFNYFPPSQTLQPRLTCRIPPQQHNSLFAHHVWNASLILADRISTSSIPGLEMGGIGEQRETAEAKESTVCELGSGAGIPGLIAARASKVKRVVLTDYDDPLLVDNLKANIDLAYAKDEEARNKLVAFGHTWGEEGSLNRVLEANDNERFTHILLADTLWLTDAQRFLLSSLTRLLALTPSARIHLVAGFHSGRNAVRSFLRKAKEVGLEKKEEKQRWEELAVGGETRRWGWDLEGDGDKDGTGWVEEKESSSERGKWVVVGEMGWSEAKLAACRECGEVALGRCKFGLYKSSIQIACKML